jgi:hypothetical protein
MKKKFKTTYMANLFGRHILLFAFAYVGGDPPPNQIAVLDNTEHTRNGVANRGNHTAHGCKMHPSFEDFITKIFDLVRRYIFLLALGGLCFARGCCLSLSLTRRPPVAILMEKCTGTFFSLGTKTLAITTVFQYMRKTSAFCCRLCSLADMAILFRHSSLNYREFKTKNWREHVPATSIHSILNPFKLLA